MNNNQFIIKKYDSVDPFRRPELTKEETEQLVQEMKETQGVYHNLNHFYIDKVLSFVLNQEHDDIKKDKLNDFADEINQRLTYPQSTYCNHNFIQGILTIALMSGKEINPEFSLKDIDFEKFKNAQKKYQEIRTSYIEPLEDNIVQDTVINGFYYNNMVTQNNKEDSPDDSKWKLLEESQEKQMSSSKLLMTEVVQERLKQLRETPDNSNDKNKRKK